MKLVLDVSNNCVIKSKSGFFGAKKWWKSMNLVYTYTL